MKLLLLGTTGYHPNARRHTACLMLPELGLVLDAGTAMFRVRDHLATDTLDIFLSHAHLDHVIGLTFLLDMFVDRPPMRSVTVHGEAAKLTAVREHLFSELLFPVLPDCRFQPLSGPVGLPRRGRLTYFPLAHPGGAIGYRLDWPKGSLAYVTDTTATPDADYLKQIRGVDLLVHECYFDDSQTALAQTTGHSCTTPVAQLARNAGVGRLVLVHMNPLDAGDDPIDLAAARRIFPATLLGEDLLELEF